MVNILTQKFHCYKILNLKKKNVFNNYVMVFAKQLCERKLLMPLDVEVQKQKVFISISFEREMEFIKRVKNKQYLIVVCNIGFVEIPSNFTYLKPAIVQFSEILE